MGMGRSRSFDGSRTGKEEGWPKRVGVRECISKEHVEYLLSILANRLLGNRAYEAP